MIDKKLARDINTVIIAEQIKQLVDELIRAGFTKTDAIEYASSLMAKIVIGIQEIKRIKGEKNG